MWGNFFPKSTDQKQHANKEQKVLWRVQTKKKSRFANRKVLPQVKCIFFISPNLMQAVQGHSAPLCVRQY